jgi:hypothetical protein
MDASKDYMDNMFGASYVSQFLKKKKKEKAAKEEVSCGRDDAKPCGEGRGEVRAGGDVPEGKTSSSTGGEKNKVMSVKQKEKREKEFAENRAKAFVPSTKNTFVGPPTPDYLKKK